MLRIGCLVVIAAGVAGCDKCGTPVKFNAPSLPNTCGANADESR